MKSASRASSVSSRQTGGTIRIDSSGIQFALDRTLAFFAFSLVAFLAVFVLENPQSVSVDLLFYESEVPLGLWSLLMFLGGVAVAAVPAALMMRKSRLSGDQGVLVLLLLVPSFALCGLALLLAFI